MNRQITATLPIANYRGKTLTVTPKLTVNGCGTAEITGAPITITVPVECPSVGQVTIENLEHALEPGFNGVFISANLPDYDANYVSEYGFLMSSTQLSGYSADFKMTGVNLYSTSATGTTVYSMNVNFLPSANDYGKTYYIYPYLLLNDGTNCPSTTVFGSESSFTVPSPACPSVGQVTIDNLENVLEPGFNGVFISANLPDYDANYVSSYGFLLSDRELQSVVADYALTNVNLYSTSATGTTVYSMNVNLLPEPGMYGQTYYVYPYITLDAPFCEQTQVLGTPSTMTVPAPECPAVGQTTFDGVSTSIQPGSNGIFIETELPNYDNNYVSSYGYLISDGQALDGYDEDYLWNTSVSFYSTSATGNTVYYMSANFVPAATQYGHTYYIYPYIMMSDEATFFCDEVVMGDAIQFTIPTPNCPSIVQTTIEGVETSIEPSSNGISIVAELAQYNQSYVSEYGFLISDDNITEFDASLKMQNVTLSTSQETGATVILTTFLPQAADYGKTYYIYPYLLLNDNAAFCPSSTVLGQESTFTVPTPACPELGEITYDLTNGSLTLTTPVTGLNDGVTVDVAYYNVTVGTRTTVYAAQYSDGVVSHILNDLAEGKTISVVPRIIVLGCAASPTNIFGEPVSICVPYSNKPTVTTDASNPTDGRGKTDLFNNEGITLNATVSNYTASQVESYGFLISSDQADVQTYNSDFAIAGSGISNNKYSHKIGLSYCGKKWYYRAYIKLNGCDEPVYGDIKEVTMWGPERLNSTDLPYEPTISITPSTVVAGEAVTLSATSYMTVGTQNMGQHPMEEWMHYENMPEYQNLGILYQVVVSSMVTQFGITEQNWTYRWEDESGNTIYSSHTSGTTTVTPTQTTTYTAYGEFTFQGETCRVSKSVTVTVQQ